MKVEGARPQAADLHRQKLHKAAQDFEAVFLKEMMKTAMPSSSREQSVYGDCLADSLAQEASRGKGIGLASWIEANEAKWEAGKAKV